MNHEDAQNPESSTITVLEVLDHEDRSSKWIERLGEEFALEDFVGNDDKSPEQIAKYIVGEGSAGERQILTITRNVDEADSLFRVTLSALFPSRHTHDQQHTHFFSNISSMSIEEEQREDVSRRLVRFIAGDEDEKPGLEMRLIPAGDMMITRGEWS